MKGFKNIREIKDVFYLFGLQGLNYFAPLLVFPYLIIVLGAEKFGYIGFSLAVMWFLMLVVDFGFNLSGTKRIALAKDNQVELNKIFTATFYAKIGLLVASFLILLILVQVPQFAVYRQVLFVMFLMVVGQTFTFVWLFQGLGQIRFIAIFNAIARLSILPLMFIFVKSPDDYLTAAFLQSFVSIFAMLISVAYVVKKRWVQLTVFVRQNVLVELKESYPIFLSSAATSIYMASFVLVLGFFKNPEVVGQYTAVDRIMRAMSILVFAPVAQAFYPKIVSLGVENRAQALALVKKIFTFVVAAMMLIFFALFFLSPLAIDFLPESYENTLPIFRIMAFVPIFVGAGGIVAQLGILALGNETDKKNYQRVYFIAGTVALISIFISVPLWGAIGASVSLLITEVVVCGLMFWFGRRILKKIELDGCINHHSKL